VLKESDCVVGSHRIHRVEHRLCEHWHRLYTAVTGADNGDGKIRAHLLPEFKQKLETCDSALDQLYKRLLKAR